MRQYVTYLRVEKGLRPLTCEAYQRDLSLFAEYLEGAHGAADDRRPRAGGRVSRALAEAWGAVALGGAQAFLPARLL